MNKQDTNLVGYYRLLCESRGLAWSEYSDCDEWTLTMLFEDFDYDEDEEI